MKKPKNFFEFFVQDIKEDISKLNIALRSSFYISNRNVSLIKPSRRRFIINGLIISGIVVALFGMASAIFILHKEFYITLEYISLVIFFIFLVLLKREERRALKNFRRRNKNTPLA